MIVNGENSEVGRVPRDEPKHHQCGRMQNEIYFVLVVTFGGVDRPRMLALKPNHFSGAHVVLLQPMSVTIFNMSRSPFGIAALQTDRGIFSQKSERSGWEDTHGRRAVHGPKLVRRVFAPHRRRSWQSIDFINITLYRYRGSPTRLKVGGRHPTIYGPKTISLP